LFLSAQGRPTSHPAADQRADYRADEGCDSRDQSGPVFLRAKKRIEKVLQVLEGMRHVLHNAALSLIADGCATLGEARFHQNPML
jgi:hypothetical protein